MSGRLAEVDEEANVAEVDGPPGDAADETSTRTIVMDPGTPIDDLRRLSLLWRVKMTQIQMIEDRGYHLTQLDVEMREVSTSPAAFWMFLSSKIPNLKNPSIKSCSITALWDFLTETYVSKTDPQSKNLVVYLPPPLGKAFPTMRLTRVIQVVKREPTLRYLDVIYEFPMTKLVRQKLASTNRVVAEWSYSDLVMPITRSVYVGSQFRVLSPEEFATDYTKDPIAARAGLPAICRDDPLARYFQWTMDTVVRSVEMGDVNVAVTRLLKDYVITGNTIFAATDSIEPPNY